MLKLSNETVYLLSSGQVITSVSNAIKELVENSLDANADLIEVKLEKYGLGKIEVRDNGSGIKSSDVGVAAQGHFTSKIKSHSDLQELTTYGFRGEALCSLCEVADVTITTRTQYEPYSIVYVLDSRGIIKSKKPSHIAQGTTITVLNLFRNLPVRKQFYSSSKKLKEEIKVAEDLLMAFSVAHPQVQFKLINDRCIIWQKSPTDDVKTSFLNILKLPSMKLHTIEHNCQYNTISTKIYFPETFVTRKSKDRFFLIVNKRPIRNKHIEKLVRQNLNEYANGSFINGGWPAILVIIELPLPMVDVNVNPSKTEVHISIMQAILDLLTSAFKLFHSSETKTTTLCQEKLITNDHNNKTNPNKISSLLQMEKSSVSICNKENNKCAEIVDEPKCISVTTECDEISEKKKNINFSTVTHLSNKDENIALSCHKSPLKEKESNNLIKNNAVDIDSNKNMFDVPLLVYDGEKSSGIGSKVWSCGKAVTDISGNYIEPVKVIRPLVSSVKNSNDSLKQSTLNCVKKPSASNKPHNADVDLTDQTWENLNKSEHGEMVDIVCTKNDTFPKQKPETKKRKLRKSFAPLVEQQYSDENAVSEPEKVQHSFNFQQLAKKIPKLNFILSECSSDFVNFVGFLSEPKAALISFKSKYYGVNLYRLQETSIFLKLSDSFKIPCTELEQFIELNKSNTNPFALSCLQALDYSDVTHLLPDAAILDKRILFNGFKIRKINNSFNTLQLHAMASSIPCYGLNDLTETVMKIFEQNNASIRESRPRKCIYYLQSEASRIARSSPLYSSRQQIMDDIIFLKNKQSWIDFLSVSQCFHNKQIFYELNKCDGNS